MKKIKLVIGLIVCFCILSLSAINITFASASIAYDEMDRLFQSTLSEILDYENAEDTAISAKKEMLYDIALNPLGILYRFDYQDTQGFAIVINNGLPTVTEIVLDATVPYDENDNTKVYVNLETYWHYDGSAYYDSISGVRIANEAVEQMSGNAFFGAVEFTYSSEQVNYLYRSETKYNVLTSIPTYIYGLTNGCAAVAGTNLLAYYDRYYTNLIPNYDSGTLFLGVYVFKVANDTTNALSETLHSDMKTNTTQAGTTVAQFRTGLTAYANRQGYSFSYTSVMSGSQINYESAKSVVQNNKAIALFLGGYRGTTITANDGFDVLSYEYSSANHIVAGFGCLEVNYTLTNNQVRTDKYIHCSMGTGLYRNGYINIAATQINDALAINIS